MPLIRIDAIEGRSKERGVDVADLLLEQDHLVTVTTESPVAAVATTDPNAKSKPRIFLGLTMGLLAAAIGALYSVYATYGLARGLKSADMTFLRTSVAGILTLPVLVYYLCFDAKVLTGQWRRWLAVALLTGPLFGELIFTVSL